MIRLNVKIEEYEPRRVNIVKKRVVEKVETEVETVIAAAIEAAIKERINEIIAVAEEVGLRADKTQWRRGAERVTEGGEV
jgi:hypothetical protein